MAKFSIVGFDPGSLRNIGWSVVTLNKRAATSKGPPELNRWTEGTIVLPKGGEKWEVLWPIMHSVDTFLDEVRPDLVIIEQTSSFAGGFVTGQVSQCIGVILALCGKFSFEVSFVYPSHVKKVVTNSGKAKKPAIQKCLKTLLGNYGVEVSKFNSDHSADATANIFCWLIDKGLVPRLEFE